MSKKVSIEGGLEQYYIMFIFLENVDMLKFLKIAIQMVMRMNSMYFGETNFFFKKSRTFISKNVNKYKGQHRHQGSKSTLSKSVDLCLYLVLDL